MKYFTSKAYLICYEQRFFYDRTYGVKCICNKRSEADIKLEELKRDTNPTDKIEYKIVEVDLDKGARLFDFYY